MNGSRGFLLPFQVFLGPENRDDLSGQVGRTWRTVDFPSRCILSGASPA